MNTPIIIDKTLTSQNPVVALELLRKDGTIHDIIPELEETYGMTQNKYHFGTVWEHTMAVLEHFDIIRNDGRLLSV